MHEDNDCTIQRHVFINRCVADDRKFKSVHHQPIEKTFPLQIAFTNKHQMWFILHRQTGRMSPSLFAHLQQQKLRHYCHQVLPISIVL